MKNINNEARNRIFFKVENLNQKTFYNQDTCISMVANHYYQKLKESDDKVVKTLFSSVLYLDFYKCVNYLLKNSMEVDFNERNFLKITDDLSQEGITNMLLDNYDFFLSAVAYSYRLKSLSIFEKLIIYGSLSDDENKKLTDKFMNHKYDLDTYKFEITSDFVTEKINELYDAKFSLDDANDILVKFMMWLEKNQESDYDNLLKIFIESDTKFNIEIVENDYNISELEEVMPKVEVIRLLCLDKENLLMEYKKNPNYVRKAISSFLVFSTKYIESIKKEEETNEKQSK